MLDPSSSEDTGGESDPEVVQEPPRKGSACVSVKRGNSSSSSSGGSGSSRAGGHKRPPATPAAAAGKGARDSAPPEAEDEEKKERERQQKEEEERKIKLQIYVFVLRCIAYPFNAKQPTDMARRQQKCTKRQSYKLVIFRNIFESLTAKTKDAQLDYSHWLFRNLRNEQFRQRSLPASEEGKGLT